jgi:hypothetical protein
MLIRLLERDQVFRELLGKVDFKTIDSIIHQNDLSNMEIIRSIIKKIGFPDRSKVGNDGADAVFILLMHTLNDRVNQKQNSDLIFPVMETAVMEGNFPPFYYAILIDRQRAIGKEEQLFGTYWENKGNKRIITPIENVEFVDDRRLKIGLPSLAYISNKLKLILPKGYRTK